MPMRAAVLMLNRGRGSGGVARQHAQSLMDYGHEVVLLHPGMDEGLAGADNRDVPLHSPILPVHEFLPAAGSAQKAVAHMSARRAAAYLRDYEAALFDATKGADLIVAHHANLTAIAAHRIAMRRKIPYVIFIHGTGIEPYHRSGYVPEIWSQIAAAVERAAGLIVTTEYVRDELVRPVVRVPRSRFLVLPCGIDLEEFHPEAVGDVKQKYRLPDTYAISPGALTWLKGPQNVVAASRRYHDLAPTIFIGDGNLRGELESRIANRGRFLGFVPREDKAALINAATVLVAAPEKLEHFGIIYAEALGGGTVPVAYEGGGVNSIVTDDVGALTPRSPDELGQTVRTILGDDSRRTTMARAGRERAETYFDDAQLGVKLVNWLESVAHVRRHRSPAATTAQAGRRR